MHRLNCSVRGLKGLVADKPEALGQASIWVPHDLWSGHDHAECTEGIVQQLHHTSVLSKHAAKRQSFVVYVAVLELQSRKATFSSTSGSKLPMNRLAPTSCERLSWLLLFTRIGLP